MKKEKLMAYLYGNQIPHKNKMPTKGWEILGVVEVEPDGYLIIPAVCGSFEAFLKLSAIKIEFKKESHEMD